MFIVGIIIGIPLAIIYLAWRLNFNAKRNQMLSDSWQRRKLKKRLK